MKKIFLLCLITFLACQISLAQGADNFVIATKQGKVRGFDQEGTMAFLGIPYAKVERFMPPLPAGEWQGIRDCNQWGPQAMQPTNGRRMTDKQMSERNSCVLNVWTTDTEKPKPVMVWLHGGGFDSGSSQWNPGMQLAKKDVVVVGINHRLNILGFLDLSACSPKYKMSGNAGMLDIVAALQWIRENIRQFGGDPSNVTIFGESGGGGKVGTLMCMPAAKGLFHKAVIMSGTILNVNTKQMSQELGKAVIKELGIEPANIDQIKNIPYQQLYDAGQRAMAASIGTRKPGTPMMWGFGPTPDGMTMTQQPFQPEFAKLSSDIPLLIGTTFNELQRLRYKDTMTENQAREELTRTFGEDTDNYIKAFKEAYPEMKPQDWLSIDWLFRPKTIITADSASKSRKAPTFMYMFTWRSPVTQGSVHGNELNFCFNTLNLSRRELPEISAEDRKLAEIMSDVWSEFAHTGKPGIDALPEWQPYTAENGETMIFGHKCEVWHNRDRKLMDIINRNCFKQLDEWNKKEAATL